MVERGLLEARGEGKARTYHLAASVYRRLGEATGYVRTKGFDDIQQEQMVMTFVDRHSEISRGAVPARARPGQRLLRRLRNEGKLVLVGERRGAKYKKPGKA